MVTVLPALVAAESYKYCTLYCTGYMRSWLGSRQESDDDDDDDEAAAAKETCLSCLVMMCRPLPLEPQQPHHSQHDITVPAVEFVTRFAIDGKFTFVDQR